MASVVRGAESVEADAFLTLPADMPGISAEVIDTVIDWWEAESPWAAMTAYLDRASHPFLLSRAALDEAAEVEGPKVLWRMLGDDDSGRVTRVTVAQTAPRDINTPQEYEALLADG
jgi:CTP:molybdopterin cytidylyltransferase MocA